jgi:leader peptidase (prepilin peptidase)/N-methyltransferase
VVLAVVLLALLTALLTVSLTAFYAVAGALLGAALGSYLGSAAWRIPNHHSLNGRSVCPGCGRQVPAYLNLPIVAYLVLRGRAACCGTRLSPWYLLLETATAGVGAAAGAWAHMWGLAALAVVVIGGSLLWKLVVDRRSPA